MTRAVNSQDLDGNTPLAKVESHYSNSWGGSQYEPNDDDDHIVDHDSNRDGAEVAPEGEDDDGDEIRMSTMCIQMNAMRITSLLADTNKLASDASDEEMECHSCIPLHTHKVCTESVDDLPDLVKILDNESETQSNLDCAEQLSWNCTNCTSGIMRIIGSHDEEDEIRAICTDCQKTTILQIRQRYADDITIVRINAMWTGYDDFDNYFSELYEDDYWNTSPIEDEEDSNVSVESSPVQHSFGDDNESLEYLNIGDAEVHGPPSLITPNDNKQADLITRLNIGGVQSTIPSLVEDDDNTSSPDLVPLVTPAINLRRPSMNHATTQAPLTEEPEGSELASLLSISSPKNRYMDNDPSTINPGHDDEGMGQQE